MAGLGVGNPAVAREGVFQLGQACEVCSPFLGEAADDPSSDRHRSGQGAGAAPIGGSEELGGGLVAHTEGAGGFREVVTHCASGRSIVVDLDPSGLPDPGAAARTLAREAAASREVVTLDGLAARLAEAVGPSEVPESHVPNSECMCLVVHPGLAGPDGR